MAHSPHRYTPSTPQLTALRAAFLTDDDGRWWWWLPGGWRLVVGGGGHQPGICTLGLLFLFRGIKWQAKYVKRRHPILATCIKFIPVPTPPPPLLSYDHDDDDDDNIIRTYR